MAVKKGLSIEEATKELECLFSWAELYFLGWQSEKNHKIQAQIEEHRIYYGLEDYMRSYETN